MFTTFAIFGNTSKQETLVEVRRILALLQNYGAQVVLSNEIRQEMNLREFPSFNDYAEKIDFAISIGGDGTFLTTASAIGSRKIPILGINSGHLGFLSDIQSKSVERSIKRLIAGKYTIENRHLLHVTCSEGGHLASEYALNEVAVMKQSLSSVILVHTTVNGDFLHTYRADGLILSTPTGSTAYNMSVGGPIVVPKVQATILSPIAGHSLNVRPLIIPETWPIDLKIDSRNSNYMVSIDGRSQILSTNVTLHIEQADYTIQLLKVDHHTFFRSLKDKLGWGASNI